LRGGFGAHLEPKARLNPKAMVSGKSGSIRMSPTDIFRLVSFTSDALLFSMKKPSDRTKRYTKDTFHAAKRQAASQPDPGADRSVFEAKDFRGLVGKKPQMNQLEDVSQMLTYNELPWERA